MSGTDKDDPERVRALHDPRAEQHHCWDCEHHPLARVRGISHPCQIDKPGGHCYWLANDRRRWLRAPTRRELNADYFAPEREHVRVTLRAAVMDYNTNGDTDAEPITRQTRHSTWHGGYWD